MGTSIVLNDVVFSNKNLPVVAELLTDGLVAAYRPTISVDSLVDLSGNGVQTIVLGNPEFFDGYVRGYFQNGFRIEAAETESVTLMLVCRTMRKSNSNLAVPLGSRWDGTGSSRGCQIFFNTPPSQPTKIYQNYSAWIKSSTGGDVNNYASNGPLYHTMSSETDNSPGPFVFVALTLDAASNTIKQYMPRTKGVAVGPIGDNLLKGRRITNPANGQMNRFEVCSAAGYSAAVAYSDVAEVLIYNKALTEAQIYGQYELSKKFFEKNRSIVI